MNIVILAAGMGKRMNSNLPKVLHLLAGKPLLGHVIDTANLLSPSKINVVYGHGGDLVREAFIDSKLTFSLQEPQLGTGHAVMQAVPELEEDKPTLILYGDVPLITAATLKRLVKEAGNDKLAILTAKVENPTGLGRILRENGEIKRIVEEKDATDEERAITEINTGIMVVPTVKLKSWLALLSNNNAQKEYYLTDIVAAAVSENIQIVSSQPEYIWEILGINNKKQLAELERIHQGNIANALMEQGVRLADPARIDVRGSLQCGRDVFIDVNCVFEGNVVLGDNTTIGPNCYVSESTVGNG